MENNLENKANFFAQYWGQEVLIDESIDALLEVCLNDLLNVKIENNNCYLKLKPLSKISDEDLLEMLRLYNSTMTDADLKSLTIEDKLDISDCLLGKADIAQNETSPLVYLAVYDFLRSKSYALPYMGLSVEEQVERGWVRLIDN